MDKYPFSDYVDKAKVTVTKGCLVGALGSTLLFVRLRTGILVGASVGAGFAHSELTKALKTHNIIKEI